VRGDPCGGDTQHENNEDCEKPFPSHSNPPL
jgi:hypothetical protein